MKKYGYVYVVQCGPYYKIGYRKNPDQRITQLATQPPFELELKYIWGWSDARSLETELHRLFEHSHVRGEWFELDAMDLEILADLHKTIGIFNRVSRHLMYHGITPILPPKEAP